MSLQVHKDSSEVKVLWVVGGLSTRVADVSLLKQRRQEEYIVCIWSTKRIVGQGPAIQCLEFPLLETLSDWPVLS